MTYRVASMDVAAGESAFTLAPGEEGYAVLVRRNGRPVGFVLRSAARNRPESRVELGHLIDEGLAERLVVAAMREELPELQKDTLSTEPLRVTFAICTKDRPVWVARCLDSLRSLDRGQTGRVVEIDVLVVDNAPSTDETRDIATRRPEVRYVRELRAGLNFARNRAISEAKGDFIAFLDDDVVVDPGWLNALLRASLAHPQAGLFTGQVLPLELETRAQLLFEQRGGFRRGFDRTVFHSRRAGDPFYPCSVGVLGTGANMVVRRSLVQAIGGFDEALDAGRPLPGGGDLDIFYRILRAGHEAVYEPGCLVFHQHRRDMPGLRRQYRDSWGTAFMAFAMKSLRQDPPMRLRWLALIAWWFGKQGTHLARSLVGRHPRPPGLILQEAYGGIIGILGAYGRSRRRLARITGASP